MAKRRLGLPPGSGKLRKLYLPTLTPASAQEPLVFMVNSSMPPWLM
ncbi:MAG: hypothetical protein LAQ30_20580 [Acidobacteriia bacterium]|nr:hypothetical protein [Terriglobia bacterium]